MMKLMPHWLVRSIEVCFELPLRSPRAHSMVRRVIPATRDVEERVASIGPHVEELRARSVARGRLHPPRHEPRERHASSCASLDDVEKRQERRRAAAKNQAPTHPAWWREPADRRRHERGESCAANEALPHSSLRESPKRCRQSRSLAAPHFRHFLDVNSAQAPQLEQSRGPIANPSVATCSPSSRVRSFVAASRP
jgi:hypothetical protein